MKKAVALFLALCMAASMAGCGGTSPSNGSQQGSGPVSGSTSGAGGAGYQDTLTVVLKTDAGTLSPFELNSGNMKRIARPILEPLVYYDSNGELVNILIDSHEYNEDCTSLTLHLKHGILFHNGEELKAEDVKYTIEGYYNGNTKSDVSKIDVGNIEIVDEYTIKLPTADGIPNSTLLDYLKNVQIVNKKFMESESDTSTKMVGTGPYKLVEYVSGDHLTYELFEQYHGAYDAVGEDGYGKTKVLVQRFISESSTAMIELEGGNVDLVMDPLTADIERVESGSVSGLQTITGPMLNLYFAAFNCGEGICSDVRVRQAIAYAVNKSDIQYAAFDSYSEMANSPIPKDSVGYDAKYDVNPYEYNVEKAKELLKSAGVAEGAEITLVIDNGSYYAAIADQLIYQLNKAGLSVKLTQYDTATVNEMIFNTNDWNMVLRNYTCIGEPQTSLDLYGKASLSGLGGSVCTRLINDPIATGELAALLEEVPTKADYNERCGVYSEIQKLWSDNLWTLPLINRTTVGLATDQLTGAYTLGSSVYPQFAYVVK